MKILNVISQVPVIKLGNVALKSSNVDNYICESLLNTKFKYTPTPTSKYFELLQIPGFILLQTTSLGSPVAKEENRGFHERKDAQQHKYYITRSKKLTKFSFSMKRSPCESVPQAAGSAREIEGDNLEIKKN